MNYQKNNGEENKTHTQSSRYRSERNTFDQSLVGVVGVLAPYIVRIMLKVCTVVPSPDHNDHAPHSLCFVRMRARARLGA